MVIAYILATVGSSWFRTFLLVLTIVGVLLYALVHLEGRDE